jgi:hypothetical protein
MRHELHGWGFRQGQGYLRCGAPVGRQVGAGQGRGQRPQNEALLAAGCACRGEAEQPCGSRDVAVRVSDPRVGPVDHPDRAGVEEEIGGLEIAVADDRPGHLEQGEDPLRPFQGLRPARRRAAGGHAPGQAQAAAGQGPLPCGARPPGYGHAVQGRLGRGELAG